MAIQSLNPNYSTTRRLSTVQPQIQNSSDAKFERLLSLPPHPQRKGEGGLRKQGYFKVSDGDQGINESPMITVITVVFNGAATIEQTILSVINQAYDNVEYIIVDGGSSDGTKDIIKKYEYAIDYWVSEPDEGIYDAMNKGIILSTGRFVININVGDRLIFIPAQSLVNADADVDCVVARVMLSNASIFLPSISWFTRLHNTIHHQGCFYRRANIPKYNTNYKIFADFDLNQRIIKAGGRMDICDEVVAFHSLDGVSNDRNLFPELYEIVKENYGMLYMWMAMLFFRIRGVRSRLGLLKW